jgi:[acyl-carrier-protein] S-malonyltransferase
VPDSQLETHGDDARHLFGAGQAVEGYPGAAVFRADEILERRGRSMGKLAFLFPGQGSQKVGMGVDLKEARPEVFERYFERAADATGMPIAEYALEGPEETLIRTDVAQPALFTLSLAVAECAEELGIRADLVAGHSLGEYTAAVASGALRFEDGIRLVALRGRLMNEAQTERPGTMAAVIGLPYGRLAELCRQASDAGLVAPANLNTPAQIVVSGEVSGVESLMELAKEAGAEKVVRLPVGAAFHSELMRPAQARMAGAMEGVDWSDPRLPMAANASGGIVKTGDEVRRALIEQIASPVRWVECVHSLVGAGADTFLELGPGRVLGGLVRQTIGRETDVSSAESPKRLESFVEAHATIVE